MSDLILYVEDDETSRRVLDFIITRIMGLANFVMFENSENFLQHLKVLPQIPRVIFLDIRLQPYNGYELLKILRQEPKYQSVKVVAITATVMSSEVAQLKEAGFDGLIGKPIRQQIFPSLLNKILRGEPVWVVT
jgi:CheY-like chemotaxis protein